MPEDQPAASVASASASLTGENRPPSGAEPRPIDVTSRLLASRAFFILFTLRASFLIPCGRRCLAEGKADEGFSPRRSYEAEFAERTPHPASLREATLSHKGRGRSAQERWAGNVPTSTVERRYS